MTTTLGTTFTTTVRVIDRVHCGTTNVRTTTKPSSSTGFTKHDLSRVLCDQPLPMVARQVRRHSANFTRLGKESLSPLCFTSHQSGSRSGTSHQNSALTRSHFNVVNDCRQVECSSAADSFLALEVRLARFPKRRPSFNPSG